MGDKARPSAKWQDIITPTTVSVILGKKGSGKSCLAYWLVDTFSYKYDLLPVIVGFPREKQNLLPQTYVIKSLEDALITENAMLLIDEGTTMLPAGQRLDELVKSFIALSRQREQIVIFIFHASRDVGSKILRGVDAIIVKEPSQRQIEYGSKTDWFRHFLEDAKVRFKQIKDDDTRKFAYVDNEDPEFRGMLTNPIPPFWTKDLSKAWSGIGIEQKNNYNKDMGDSPSPQRRKWVVAPEIEARPEEFSILPQYSQGIITSFKMDDPERNVISNRANIVAEIHKEYPGVRIDELQNAQITYSDYYAIVELKPRLKDNGNLE